MLGVGHVPFRFALWPSSRKLLLSTALFALALFLACNVLSAHRFICNAGYVASPLFIEAAYIAQTIGATSPVTAAPLNPQHADAGIQLTYTGGVCNNLPNANYTITYSIACLKEGETQPADTVVAGAC